MSKETIEECSILGLDPGSKNAGYAVLRVRIKKKKLQYKIEETGKLKNLLTDLKIPHRKILQKHVGEVRAIIKKYGIKYVLAERYMARGGKQATIEYVNQMLGALEYALPVEVTQISAATWKNRINRIFDLKKYYKECYRVEPHEIDAVFQSMWLAEKKFDRKFTDKFGKSKNRKNLTKVIECKTTSVLKKQKKR